MPTHAKKNLRGEKNPQKWPLGKSLKKIPKII
jgi:hypothetical protein